MSAFGKETWSQSDYSRKRWQQDYDDYLARIKPYEGSSFYQELLNNPYFQYQDFQGNFFQGIWANTTGDYSAWDKFYNDRKTSGDEYLAQILDAQRQQQYDSPAAQVQRRAAAGLNDDLNGGQAVGSGEAAQAVPDDTPPPSEHQDPLAVTSEIMSVGFQLFQSGMSMFSFLQDMKGKSIANASADIGLTEQGYDSMLKILAGNSSMPSTREEYEGLSEEEKAGLDDQLIQSLDAAIKNGEYKHMFSTRRAKSLMKVLRGNISYDKNGKPTLAYQAYRNKLLAQAYGDHKTAAGVIGTPGYSDDLIKFGEAIGNTYGQIDLHIQQALEKIRNAQARSAEAQADYDEGALTNDRGSMDAAAAIAGDQATISAEKNRKIIEDMRKSINAEFDKLRQVAESKGGLEGMILKLLIPYARARTEQIINQGILPTVGGAASSFFGPGKITMPSLQSQPVP